jgi:hypothetical protein
MTSIERYQVISVVRDNNGFIGIQYDGSGNEEGDRPEPVEALMPYGILTMPRAYAGNEKPGANCLIQIGNGIAWGMACNDPRVMTRLPPLEEGSTFLYGDINHPTATTFVWIDGKTGNLQLYAPHGSTASTMAFNVANADDAIIQILHGKGMGLVMRGSGTNGITIHNRDGSAAIEINDDGVVIRGKVKIVGGLVAGNAVTAEDVALAGPLVALMSKFGPVFGFAAGLAQAAGVITADDAAEIIAAAALYALPPNAPATRTSVVKGSSILATV